MKSNSWFGILLLTLAAIVIVHYANAAADPPAAPNTLNPLSSSRFNSSNYASQSLDAFAGNVTQISLTAESQTKAWQGYFGNISGTIVLEDNFGFTFYDWADAEPKGEIYASTNSSPNWGGVKCFDFNDTAGNINLTTEEARYLIPDLAVDGINETFRNLSHSTFFVGPVTITANSCQSTWIYRNSTAQQADFTNVLLTDNTTLIFTTIIENDQLNNGTDMTGYNDNPMDFQLLVAEDGHNETAGATGTTYYFFVELS